MTKQNDCQPATSDEVLALDDIRSMLMDDAVDEKEAIENALVGIDLLRAALSSASSPAAGEPFCYAYVYPSPFGDGEVVRFSHGEEINGSKPLRSIPLYTALSSPAAGSDGWQPIETAPKDRTPILAINSRLPLSPVVVKWIDDDPLDDSPRWGDAASHKGDNLYFNANYFDYWRPLPPAPGK